jgi:hypothetical protein
MESCYPTGRQAAVRKISRIIGRLLSFTPNCISKSRVNPYLRFVAWRIDSSHGLDVMTKVTLISAARAGRHVRAGITDSGAIKAGMEFRQMAEYL